MGERMSVLLATEGTYPFHQGGVSTWCDIIIKNLKSIDFTVFSVLTDPYVTQKFKLEQNTTLIKVPLWGMEEPSENRNTLFSQIYLAKKRTTTQIVKTKFLPLFNDLVEQIIAEEKDVQYLAGVLLQLYELFQLYDYKELFKHELTWETYKATLIQKTSTQSSSTFSKPDLYSVIQSLGWIYRFFNIINIPIPQTTVTHSSAAAFCSLPCIISKLKYGTPFLLSEHGVYLREQYLSLSKRRYSSFLNSFLIRLIQTITQLNFTFADQVSPVCDYNIRWESRISPHPKRITTIYNGVDHAPFLALEPLTGPHRPTVVTVARIDPIKDMFTLMRAAARVKVEIPDVQFLIYGSITVPEYHTKCLELRKELQLEKTVQFVGHIADVAKAYEKGDIVAQSSISEAFPYSIIEAMFSGKPVVTTDVGGIPEAVGDTGVLVTPGNDQELAEGIIGLLTNDARRLELGIRARERALNFFSLDRSLEQYYKSYLKLAVLSLDNTANEQEERVVLHLQSAQTNPGKVETFTLSPGDLDVQWSWTERALALLDMDAVDEAREALEQAIISDPRSLAAPFILAHLSQIEKRLTEKQTNSAKQTGDERQIILNLQNKYAERAYAFAQNGFYVEAIAAMNTAVQCHPEGVSTQLFLLDLSTWYAQLENGEEVLRALYRFRAIAEVIDQMDGRNGGAMGVN